MFPNLPGREGERPREPKRLWNSEDIRAREDACAHIKRVRQRARKEVVRLVLVKKGDQPAKSGAAWITQVRFATVPERMLLPG